jgi:1-acyl-sn-glycerol-3-phosphate acyltransferase
VLAARSRLVSLWISQVARSLADSCLRWFLMLQFAQFGRDVGSPLLLLTCSLGPFILLAPLNGALSNSLAKRWVLVGSSAFCLCMTALFGAVTGAQGDLWLWCIGLGLVGTGNAVYSSVRYALLPAAAQDTGWPLNRVMGWMETRDIAPFAGILLALALGDGYRQFPAAVAAAVGLDLIALLAALPVHFPSDVRLPKPPAQAIAGFFRDCQILSKDRAARGSLLGLAYFQGLIVAGSYEDPLTVAPVGLVVGCLLAAVQGHPRRMLGLLPPAAVGLAAALVCLAASSNLLWAGLLGLMGGLLLVPLRTNFQLATAADMRGNAMAAMNAVMSLPILATALWLFATDIESPWLLVVLTAAGALVVWRVLVRETIEQLGEILLWPMYRIRVRGPGRFQIPLRGPLLVIANHTAWFDPLWLAKVLPRRLTPMMTSRFFDLPVLHWLMKNVAGAIRVPATPFRREAPELQEAIAVLDHGGCVLIFPEGWMKHYPQQSVRQFGQGVWRILRQRPDMPVVVCWIEGGWGSFTSYCGGRPGRNKHLDCRRLIEIAMEAPRLLDPALLTDQHATRNYLMRTCLQARRHLGLPPLPLQQAVGVPLEDKAHEPA